MDDSEQFLDGRVTLHPGDCLNVLARLEECSIDACVTDPPYGLSFMNKHWDHGVPSIEYWKQVLRVLKPGAHLLAFGGTRTYHRMACAIEDTGFEVRDCIQWLYGSGFPKSHDISKAVDKELGCERAKIRVDATNVRNPKATGAGRDGQQGATRPWIETALQRGFHEAVSDEAVSDEAVSDEAVGYQGFGTALKPACEPITLARKPLSESTVAANVLRWRTGALNIDSCRVGSDMRSRSRSTGEKISENLSMAGGNYAREFAGEIEGRWPANVILSDEPEVQGAFPESGPGPGNVHVTKENGGGVFGGGRMGVENIFKDSGSAARFFYTAKADTDDRLGSKHPTVKPLDLMQYLVRLITPPKGIVLDPFAGTGTTGEAAWREGMRAILIEREAEYQDDIRRRMKLALAGPDERSREAIKARMNGKPPDHGPLFGGTAIDERGGAGRFTASSRTNDWTDRNEAVNE